MSDDAPDIEAHLPDNRILKFPAGTDPSVIQSTVKKMLAPSGTERLLGTPLGSLALGAADLGLGAAQLGANIGSKLSPLLPGGEGNHSVVADWANEKMAALNAASERGRAAQGRTGFDAWRMAGGLGTGIGASLGDQAIVRGLPYATTYAGKVAQGLGLGGFFGGTAADTSTTPQTPDAYLSGQAQKAKIGAAAGGVMAGVVSPVLRGAYNLVEPYLPGGVQTMANRTLNDAAGVRQPQIVKELMKNQPMNTTAGQAAAPAGSAEFSGLQRLVEPRAPTDYHDIATQGNQSMVNSLVNHLAKTPETLKAADLARTGAAEPLYNAARAGGDVVDVAPILAHVDDVLAKNPGNGPLVKEFNAIRKGLVNDVHVKGAAYANREMPRTDAQEVSSAIDGIREALVNPRNQFIKKNLVQVKNMLAQAIPGYQAGDQAFAKASGPINEMQYGQTLTNKLTDALTDKIKPGAFAQARRNETATITNALDEPRFSTESQFLHPRQVQVLNTITDKLERNALYEELAKKGSAATKGLVEETLAPSHVPNFFMRSVMIAHHILDRLQGGAEKHTLDYLSKVMQNPQATGELMQSASPAQQAVVKALVERGATVGSGIGAPHLQRQYQKGSP